MKMMELSRAFYWECVLPVLKSEFPSIAERHAAGLIGYGSEVLGNDDEHSKFYGWGPRVNLYLTEEDHATTAEKVRDVLWEKMPQTFLGQAARFRPDPVLGAARPTDEADGTPLIAITTCERHAEWYTGHSVTPVSSKEWLVIPEPRLLEFTSGEVFHDGPGLLSNYRDYFGYFPDDVWRHRLAYQWTMLSWDIDLIGYCANRDDRLSSRVCLNRSVERIIGLVFLLNRTYKPGYLKWIHRQFYKLPHLASEMGPVLEQALITENCHGALELLYRVLDALVEFQESLGIRVAAEDWRKPGIWTRGAFLRDFSPVIEAVRESIDGPLAVLSFKTGALDQWVGDCDLLYLPEAMKALRHVYELEDPTKDLYVRERLIDRGI